MFITQINTITIEDKTLIIDIEERHENRSGKYRSVYDIDLEWAESEVRNTRHMSLDMWAQFADEQEVEWLLSEADDYDDAIHYAISWQIKPKKI